MRRIWNHLNQLWSESWYSSQKPWRLYWSLWIVAWLRCSLIFRLILSDGLRDIQILCWTEKRNKARCWASSSSMRRCREDDMFKCITVLLTPVYQLTSVINLYKNMMITCPLYSTTQFTAYFHELTAQNLSCILYSSTSHILIIVLLPLYLDSRSLNDKHLLFVKIICDNLKE